MVELVELVEGGAGGGGAGAGGGGGGRGEGGGEVVSPPELDEHIVARRPHLLPLRLLALRLPPMIVILTLAHRCAATSVLEARPCRAAACEPRTHRVLSLGIVVQHVVVGRACVAEGRR